MKQQNLIDGIHFTSWASTIGLVFLSGYGGHCFISKLHFLGWILVCAYLAKFWYLAWFRVDHLSRPIVSNFVFLLCQFAVLAYHVINRFISKPNELHSLFCCLFQVLFRYNWFLWPCFMLLFRDSFSPLSFSPFLVMFSSSHVYLP